MPPPEPTAEELNYGRTLARVYGISAPFASEMFAAGHALGARHAPPEPAGPTDVEIRLQAVDLAVRLRSGTIRMTRKADDSGVGIIEVLADATALESYIRDGQTDVAFGPGVACSCGPDSVAHIHDAPWGCTTCTCRYYPNPDPEAVNETEPVSAEDIASIARTMEGIPLADVETPEQSAAIGEDGNA